MRVLVALFAEPTNDATSRFVEGIKASYERVADDYPDNPCAVEGCERDAQS